MGSPKAAIQAVITIAAKHGVNTRVAKHPVKTSAAFHVVITRAAIHVVITSEGYQTIRTLMTANKVGSTSSPYFIVTAKSSNNIST
jgi:hypothetical protein